MVFGVQPTGFVLPTLAEILDEIEQSNVEIFGPGIIQTPQSEWGQWNGLRAERIRLAWEIGLNAYQSYDPDQAEGIPLERLAAIRLIGRQPGETDASLAQAITNAGIANTRDADFYRAIADLDGVTWVRIDANDSRETNSLGIEATSVAVSALGGDDEAIASVARRYIVPGVNSFGNTRVETAIDGFCRTITINRPVELPITLELDIYKLSDIGGCPPDPTQAIVEELVANLSGSNRPRNGVPLTKHIVARALCTKPNVEVAAVRAAREGDDPAPLPMSFTFGEIPSFAIEDVTINVLD